MTTSSITNMSPEERKKRIKATIDIYKKDTWDKNKESDGARESMIKTVSTIYGKEYQQYASDYVYSTLQDKIAPTQLRTNQTPIDRMTPDEKKKRMEHTFNAYKNNNFDSTKEGAREKLIEQAVRVYGEDARKMATDSVYSMFPSAGKKEPEFGTWVNQVTGEGMSGKKPGAGWVSKELYDSTHQARVKPGDVKSGPKVDDVNLLGGTAHASEYDWNASVNDKISSDNENALSESIGLGEEEGDSVISTSDDIRSEEKDELSDKKEGDDKLIEDNDAEILKLKQQKELKDLREEMGLDPDTGEKLESPALLDSASDFEALRSEHGMDAIESRLNTIKADERDIEAEMRASLDAEDKRMISVSSKNSAKSEIRESYQSQLDSIARRKQTLLDEYNTKAGIINTTMNLKQMDYTAAKNDYNTQFGQNIQLINLLEGRRTKEQMEENRVRDDARANLTYITNNIDDWDKVDADTLALIRKEEMKAGIPVGMTEEFAKTKPDVKVMSTTTSVDENGDKVVTFIYEDENGMPGIVKTVIVGKGDPTDVKVDMTSYLAEQGIPLTVATSTGELTKTMKQNLIDAKIKNEDGERVPAFSLEVIDGLWENMRVGNSFEEIRQGIIAQGGDPTILDTFVKTLQR